MIKLQFLQITESSLGFLTYIYAVRTQNGAIVGEARLRAPGTRSVPEWLGELGYEIDEPYRRRGYATASARALLEVARSLGMDRVALACEEKNLASRRIASRLGFEKEKEILSPERGKILKFIIKI